MPYIYKGQVVTKQIWDAASPEFKQKIIKENKVEPKVTGLFVVNNSYGIDKDTGRLGVTLRCEMEKASTFYCFASCKSFDMKNVEPNDFHIEFLENGTYATKHVAYNSDLFKGIYDMSTEMFIDIMASEPRVGAGS